MDGVLKKIKIGDYIFFVKKYISMFKEKKDENWGLYFICQKIYEGGSVAGQWVTVPENSLDWT